MGFRRRKSSAATIAVETEQQRSRNVLSKPPINRSTTTLTSPSKSSSTVTSRNNSAVALGAPLSAHSSNPETRQVIRSQIFGTQSTDSLSPSHQSKSNLVALLVSQYEAKETEAPGSDTSRSRSRSPTKRTAETPSFWGPTASTDAIKASLHNTRSRSRLSPTKGSPMHSLSPASSQDRISDYSSIPPSRRASFIPGAATRKENPDLPDPYQRQQIEDQVPPLNVPTIATEDFDPEPEWTPPARVVRSSTPADLDYTHLGPLRLGSLHVTNGRASPAFSDLSRLGFTKQQRESFRDVSSDYGGSQIADSCSVSRAPSKLEINKTTSDMNNTTSLHRNFSWQSTYTDEKIAESVDGDDRPATPVRNNSALMAIEYMAELAESPYLDKKSSLLRRASSPSKNSKNLARELSQRLSGHLQPSSPFPEGSELSEPFNSPLARTISSTGSIVRTETSDYREEDLADQILGTNFGEADYDSHYWEPSTCSVTSPKGQPSTSFPTDHFEHNRPESVADSIAIFDSGYASNISTISASVDGLHAPPIHKPTADISRISQDEVFVPPKLKTRRTEPIFPTFSIFKSKSNPNLRDMHDLKPRKKKKNKKEKESQAESYRETNAHSRNKLQKKSNQPTKGANVTVQSVQAIDVSAVPEIPSHVRRSLHVHAEELPELDQTCVTIMKKHSNPSMLDLSVTNIRFPSPEPENKNSASRSRPRRHSEGRRFSMRGHVQTGKLPTAGISKADALAIINDFGPYSNSLVISPYEMVPPVGHSNRPRSMMDDRTASEVARLRSRHLRDRENWAQRRGSFNDRGGIPGSNLRPGSIHSETPPMPLLPGPASMNSEQDDWHSSSSPAPRPPSHSPRPSFVELDQSLTDGTSVSSRPSPKPRPIVDPWAAQALAWKERRKSAGEMLYKNSGEYFRDDYDSDEAVVDEEQSYPVIPPQSHGYATPHSQHSHHSANYEDRMGSQPRHAWPAADADRETSRARVEHQRPFTPNHPRRRSIPRDDYVYPDQQSPLLDSWMNNTATLPARSPHRSPVRGLPPPQTPSQSPIPIPPRSPLRNSVTDQSFRNSMVEQPGVRSREGSPVKSVLEKVSLYESRSQSDVSQSNRQQPSPNPSYVSGSHSIRRRPVPQNHNIHSPILNQIPSGTQHFGDRNTMGYARHQYGAHTASPTLQYGGTEMWSSNNRVSPHHSYMASPSLEHNFNHHYNQNYNRPSMAQAYSPTRY